jgi:hypothetical protein
MISDWERREHRSWEPVRSKFLVQVSLLAIAMMMVMMTMGPKGMEPHTSSSSVTHTSMRAMTMVSIVEFTGVGMRSTITVRFGIMVGVGIGTFAPVGSAVDILFFLVVQMGFGQLVT